MTNVESSQAIRCLGLIRAEYLEMPGLVLTKPQARRMWGLDESTCQAVLDALVSSHFLTVTPRQTYILARPH